MKKGSLLSISAILAAVVLWGCSFAGMRIVLLTLNPWVVMWIRMTTALVILAPFASRLFPLQYHKGDWKFLLPMVIFQPCLYFVFEGKAIVLTTSSQAGILSAIVPLLTTGAAYFILSESMNPRFILGLVISLGGVVWLTMGNAGRVEAPDPVLGNFLEFLAMVSDTASMIIIKKLSTRYNPISLTAMQILGGFFFFMPGMVDLFHLPPGIMTLRLFLIIISLGVCVTLGAFGLYNWGMSRIEVSRASAFIYLTPVTAVVVGWGLLGETLTVSQCLAALIIICGVMISEKDA
jgi:drug/metabolite transporter (DMT)-like permease